MGTKWIEVPLGQLCEFRGGSAFPKRYQGHSSGTFPFIKVSDMKLPLNERRIVKANNWVGENIFDKINAKVHPAGSIVFAKIGIALTYNRRRILTMPTIIDNNMMATIPNKDVIDPLYLYYILCNLDFNTVAVGTALPYLKTGDLTKIKVSIPELPEQKAIVHILGALDEKIELNLKMNVALEAMVRTIFKSWFVDFDPVRSKTQGRPPEGMDAETATLFPDSLEDSELGKVPKGWRLTSLGKIAKVTLGGLWGEEIPFEHCEKVVCLRGCDIEKLRTYGYTEAPQRYVKESQLPTRIMSPEDVLLAASGVGPSGRSLWVSDKLIRDVYEGSPVVYSNFVKRLRTTSVFHAVYIDRVLYEMHKDNSIWDFIDGTSVPNLDMNGLLQGLDVLLPPVKVLTAYFRLVKPVYEKLYNQESRFLSRTRDALLPKLLSGKIRIKDAEKFVENIE